MAHPFAIAVRRWSRSSCTLARRDDAGAAQGGRRNDQASSAIARSDRARIHRRRLAHLYTFTTYMQKYRHTAGMNAKTAARSSVLFAQL